MSKPSLQALRAVTAMKAVTALTALTALIVSPAPALAQDAGYVEFKLLQPRDGDSLMRDDEGTVVVRARLLPRLRVSEGHRIQVVLDGVAQPTAFTASGFVLKGVDRGAHTLQLVLLATDGQRLMATMPVTFQMRQGSRLFKPTALACTLSLPCRR